MQEIYFNIRFLILLFMGTVCFHSTVNAQCKMGEPKLGEQEPDLNVTVSPSTVLQVGAEINISCEAGISRFQDKNTRPLPISRITIQFGDNTVIKECTSQGPGKAEVNKCTDTTTLNNATTQNLVICTAKSDTGCRFKVVNITFIEETITLMTTMINPTVSQAATTKALSMSSSTVIISSALKINSSTVIISSAMTISSSRVKISSGMEGSLSGSQDDDDIDTIKSIVIATLVLVATMMVFFFISIFFIIHKLSK